MTRHRDDLIDLAIDALAVARLARLATVDELPFVKRPREAIKRRYPPAGAQLSSADGWPITETDAPYGYTERLDGKRLTGIVQPLAGHPTLFVDDATGSPLGYLVECPWCTSVYLAAAVAVVRRRWPRRWDPVSLVLAASFIAGYLNSHT